MFHLVSKKYKYRHKQDIESMGIYLVNNIASNRRPRGNHQLSPFF